MDFAEFTELDVAIDAGSRWSRSTGLTGATHGTAGWRSSTAGRSTTRTPGQMYGSWYSPAPVGTSASVLTRGRWTRSRPSGGRYAAEPLALPPYPDGTPDGLRHNRAYPLTIGTPVIAALTGACAGAGFVLASYADLRFAARDCRITTSFAKLGLPAEYGIGWLLPRVIGLPAAIDLLYTARVVDGDEASRLGWVQRCHEPGEVVVRTVEFAADLARGSSAESLRVMKRQVFLDAALDLGTAYTRSVADMNAALGHPDLREGLAALRERRPTDFLARARRRLPTTSDRSSLTGHPGVV